jgi:hypothetical protein
LVEGIILVERLAAIAHIEQDALSFEK